MLSSHHWLQDSISPAQVRGEHVELLVLRDHRVEGGAVGPVDHVALGGRPPVQRAGRGKAKVKCGSRVRVPAPPRAETLPFTVPRVHSGKVPVVLFAGEEDVAAVVGSVAL